MTTAPTPTEPPAFAATVGPINNDVAARMTSSWQPGCPVGLDELSYLTLTHWDYHGEMVRGELVVNASVANDVISVFETLFDHGFPIEQMRLVDDFDGDDQRSMAANNTSGFNCRFVAGTTRWSRHALGMAIDINPLVNPWVQGDQIDPPEGAIYADRSVRHLGSINADDEVVRAFEAVGWSWGGYWSSPDYQHFDRN